MPYIYFNTYFSTICICLFIVIQNGIIATFLYLKLEYITLSIFKTALNEYLNSRLLCSDAFHRLNVLISNIL